jgi:glycosyltransferase involved in cell wall biosynthesis
MKLLQVTAALETSFGGPPNVVLNSHKNLMDAGFDTSLLVVGQRSSSFHENPEIQKILGDNVHLFPSRKSGLHGKVLSFREIIKFYKLIVQSDCVLTHQLYNFQNIYLMIIAKSVNKPIILMPHGTLTHYQKNQHRFRKLLVDDVFFDKFIKNANAIAVATNDEMNQLGDELLCKAKKIGIGINEMKLESVSRETPSIFNFLYIGRLDPIKRVDLTLVAFSKFLLKYPNSFLRIAGDGDSKIVRALHELVTDLKISEKVQFTGWVRGEQKSIIFTSSDFIILNSEKENFAIGIAEGQSFGLPALITRFVAFSEIVEEYGSGVVVETLSVESIVEGMVRLVNLDYVTLSNNSLMAAKSTSWPVVIPHWIDLVTSVIANRREDAK